jgi:hypothetical protein
MMSKGKPSMNHHPAAHEASQARLTNLEEGYRQMAADRKREMEAEEWTEALVRDTMEIPQGAIRERGSE